jgi:hypothetical protein
MSNVVNRTAVPLQILYSVNSPDYPEADWIIDPDLTILETVLIQYCKVSGDLVIEMTPAEKAVVVAAELAYAKLIGINGVCYVRENKVQYGTGPLDPLGGGSYISTTTEDQVRWLSWNVIGGKWAALGLTYPFVVYSRDGSSYVTITRSQDFTAVEEAIAVYVTNIFKEAEVVTQNVFAATTVEEVQSIVAAYAETMPDQAYSLSID